MSVHPPPASVHDAERAPALPGSTDVRITIDMQPFATLVAAADVFPLRVRYREEINGQIVHDSIHRRAGWTETYLLTLGGATAGFGSIAIGGPWKDKPTVFELYVLPAHRARAFDLFEALLTTSHAQFMEIQSNDPLLAVMLHTYAKNIWTEKIVFRDGFTTTLPAADAVLEQITPDAETRQCIEERQGGTEWQLHVSRADATAAAKGGLMFHYNPPYSDVYMEVAEPFRRRGFGSYIVQELKRVAYELGTIPCARCSPDNVASRKTLQKAGFVPCALILNGTIAFPADPGGTKPGGGA
jgi:GNAT superfamily N-acetyltransferase